MKMRAILFIGFFLINSCNQINDLQPVQPGTVPSATIQVVKNKFPESRELVFKPLLNSSIWEVKFASAADKYTSLVDESHMWETFRQNPDSLPALLNDLLRTSSFSGGNFSANAEDISFYPTAERRNKVVYNFNGADYSFDWQRYNGTNFRPTVANFQFAMYNLPVKNLSELPKTIQDYMKKNEELKFQNGEAWIRLNYGKQFLVRAEFTKGSNTLLGSMLFDESGNLKWISREFNQPDVYSPISNIDTLPPVIQQYLDQSKELAGFYHHTPAFERWRGEYKGVESYYLKLYNKDYAEVCELYFDQNYNLLNKRYFVSF